MGCFVLITKVQKICDCCGKPVAEKVGFCNWRLIRAYLTMRMKDSVYSVDPVDGLPCLADTAIDIHCCRQCWKLIVKNIRDNSQVVI